ncbi:MAG TPA: hotdog domain-containing protein [Rhodopila sp.]
MQADANPSGDIFCGWIMYLMDQAVGLAAATRAKGNVATASVSNFSFVQTLKPGDVVCVYTDIAKVGQTSITVAVEVYVQRRDLEELVRITEAEFVAVALDDHKMPRILPVAA